MKTTEKLCPAEKEHFDLIVKALQRAGYEVETPPNNGEYLDVWGYERSPGKTRRRKCFLEIYNMRSMGALVDADGFCTSAWQVGYDHEEIVEVSTHAGEIYNVQDLVAALGSIIEPLKRRRA